MDYNSLLQNHFLWGLVIGLLIWLYTLIKCTVGKHKAVKEYKNQLKSLNAEMGKLKQHLQMQLDIDSESKEKSKKEREDQQERINNLMQTIANLKTEPKKEEIILLQIYDKAVRLMNERAPGFAPTWEATLREAHLEYEKAQKGFIPFIRKIIRPSSVTIDHKMSIKQLETSLNKDGTK